MRCRHPNNNLIVFHFKGDIIKNSDFIKAVLASVADRVPTRGELSQAMFLADQCVFFQLSAP